MFYQRLRNDRGEVLDQVSVEAFEPRSSDDEKDVESWFKAYLEDPRLGWTQGTNFTRDKDIKARYSFRNDKKKVVRGKPDYIFYDDQQSILAICDVKSTRVGADEGLGDAKAYVEALIADYGLSVRLALGFDGSTFLAEYYGDAGWERVQIGDSDLSAMPGPALLSFISRSQNRVRDIEETVEIDKELLRNFFRKCDEIIRLSPIGTSATEKFIELSAVIFLKMFSLKGYDGEYVALGGRPVWEYARAGFTNKINGEFLTWLNREYSNLFAASHQPLLVRLDPARLRDLTRLVDRLFSTYELTDFTNIKGDILEFFQMESKDRKIGEFFTPRHIIKMMVELVDPRVFPVDSTEDGFYAEKVYDPACGTGGFLIEVFTRYKDRSLRLLKGLEPLKKGVFHGTELKANTTLLAKLNMILIGDGHNNIINANAFSYQKIERLPKRKDALGHYIVIPPEQVTYYEQNGEKIYHVEGDRTRKVTLEADDQTYWLFDDLGSRIEVLEEDLVSSGNRRFAPDGSPVGKHRDRYYKKHYVRHFELKNDLQEDKIPFRFEDVRSVNPRLIEPKVDGKPNPQYHMGFGNFDVVLANQPFGLSEPPKADYHFARHMLQSLHDGKRTETGRHGRIACIVGNGFLHDSVYEEERSELQSKYFIKAIISLPEKVFAPYVKAIKSNILLIEKRAPQKGAKTYFVKLEHDGFSQDDRRTPQPEKGQIKRLRTLWRRWEPTEQLDPETGMHQELPAHDTEAGFAEYHLLDPKSWAVNYYVKPRLPTFDAVSRPLADFIEDVDSRYLPADIGGPDEIVEILGVSRMYGIITSDSKPASEYRQKYKELPQHCFAYNPARVNIGSVALHQGKGGITSPYYTVFRLKNDELVPHYLLFFLKSKYGRMQIESFNYGGVRNSLSFDDLCKVQIPFLPKEKQRSFLMVLATAYEAQAKLVDSFKALSRTGIPDTLLAGFQGDPLFEEVRLEDMLRRTGKPVYGISEKSDGPENGTPILKMHNIFPIIDDILNVDDVDTMTCDEAMLEKYAVKAGDILVNRTNSFEMVGKSGLFEAGFDAVFASYLMRLSVAEEYDSEYVAFFLNLARTRRVLRESFAIQSNSQYNISFDRIKELRIAYPRNADALDHFKRAFRQYQLSMKNVGHLAAVLNEEISSAFDALLGR